MCFLPDVGDLLRVCGREYRTAGRGCRLRGRSDAALPSILAGFRIIASVALLLVVGAGMIGAEYGIGAFVLQAGNFMQTDQLLAGVMILSLFGLAVGRLINWLETRLMHWR
jgi:ABC-type nitrate/sulfonate/bicarbonate transport system permease component